MYAYFAYLPNIILGDLVRQTVDSKKPCQEGLTYIIGEDGPVHRNLSIR